jgi:multidrug efflux pump subunit AcrB
MTGMGISGKIAKAFIRSKLTPLLVIAAFLMGIFAVFVTPREEEPQIVVPMVDVYVSYPGATPKEVEERVTNPMEKLLWEIKGVEYVYSIVKPGFNITIVRFYVGEKMEDSLVKLYNKLMSNYDSIPPGVSQPLVKPKSIDDVPVLALTLWSNQSRYSGYELRRIAMELCGELKKDANVSEFSVIGGQKRQVRLTLDPQRLQAYNLSVIQIMNSLSEANVIIPSGSFPASNRETIVETGSFLKNAQEVGQLVVHVFNGRPVYLRDVARISDGPAEAANYVFMGLGPAAAKKGLKGDPASQSEAVTIAIAKQKGANASLVAGEALRKVEALKGHLIPSDVEVTVTRNYGETAKDKSDELLDHMLLATISVIILIALFLGWRESIVVAVAVPVTLSLTLLINYLYG